MIDQARWSLLERVFHEALERDPGERDEFIQTACGSDEELKSRIQSLLRHDDLTQSLDRSAMAGPRIGPYQVISKLGKGGMGEVYLAHDSRLDRPVALKILSRQFGNDPERKRRFLCEAKAASALDHPNIARIYDIGADGKLDYLVMEYVAGKPLDRLIPRSGLKLKEALQYAVQVADALACAHAAGIIHRDVKPANVLIDERGLAKVVDFGIAKQLRAGPDAGTVTQAGAIVGTTAYMSPEQAEGKPVDARSDIFSFGSLLYEMITGRRAFQRDTSAATLAAVIHDDPQPVFALSDDVPVGLERFVGRCLRKHPAERFGTIAEVGAALKTEQEQIAKAADAVLQANPRVFIQKPEGLSQHLDAGSLGPASGQPKNRRAGPLGAAVALLLLALFTAAIWFVRSRINPPEPELVAVPLTAYAGREVNPTFSPDGSQVAFAWCKELQRNACSIYIKQVGIEPPYRLTDAESDCCPAWSPDGRFIAFIRWLSPTRFAVILIPQRGGRERILTESDCSQASIYGRRTLRLAWTPDSRWLAVPEADKEVWALMLRSVETEEKRTLTHPDASKSGVTRRSLLGDTGPAFSPDGRTLVFSRGLVDEFSADLYLLPLADGYTPEREPEKVRLSNPWNAGAVWLPDGREIVFSSGPASPGSSGLWRMAISESARPRRLAFAPGNASAPAISRQAGRLAYVVEQRESNIWRIALDDIRRGPRARVQFIASSQQDYEPAYSPDGRRIAFVSKRSGAPEIWVCDGDGSNPVQLTSIGGTSVFGPQWSWDGRNIAFWINTEDVYVVNASGGAPRRLETTPGGGKWPYWSRDGKWLYFVSSGDYSGIWKMPLGGGESVRLTRKREDMPQASPDGKFIYYMTGWPYPVTVWRMPVDGGEATKVLDSVHPYGRWAVGERGIFYFTAADEKGRSNIRFHDFATGRSRTILTIERPVGISIALSPDGRTILYEQIDDAGSDVMLVENFH